MEKRWQNPRSDLVLAPGPVIKMLIVLQMRRTSQTFIREKSIMDFEGAPLFGGV